MQRGSGVFRAFANLLRMIAAMLDRAGDGDADDVAQVAQTVTHAISSLSQATATMPTAAHESAAGQQAQHAQQTLLSSASAAASASSAPSATTASATAPPMTSANSHNSQRASGLTVYATQCCIDNRNGCYHYMRGRHGLRKARTDIIGCTVIEAMSARLRACKMCVEQ